MNQVIEAPIKSYTYLDNNYSFLLPNTGGYPPLDMDPVTTLEHPNLVHNASIPCYQLNFDLLLFFSQFISSATKGRQGEKN